MSSQFHATIFRHAKNKYLKTCRESCITMSIITNNTSTIALILAGTQNNMFTDDDAMDGSQQISFERVLCIIAVSAHNGRYITLITYIFIYYLYYKIN